MTPAHRTFVHQLAEANIPTWQQFRILQVNTGGSSSVGCLEWDLKNKEWDDRKDVLGHDAKSLIDHFEEEKARDENFYFACDTVDGSFSCCFWLDHQSRAVYMCFADAVVFDTTYNTNMYDMIFAEFVGVNNHRQTIVFGCGLLSNEKIGPFNWLFSQFLEAMPNHKPSSLIITDQDVAITHSVADIFPTTFHRFFSWHILNKFAEKFRNVLYKQQYRNLENVIDHLETPEEFESE